MSIETMTKLSTQTVGVGGTASITFSNIPQSYTDLVILTSARASNGARYDDGLSISFNSSTSNFTGKDLWGNSSSASSGSYTSGFIAFMPGSSTTANTFSNNQIYIPNYAGSTYKSISVESNQENNSSTINQSFVQMEASLWSNTSAITSITLQSWYGNTLAQHSTFTLYGIRNARRSTPTPGWATGGSVSFDGTYFTHTFTSSGLFIPNKDLTVDYLVVGGGGAGGGWGGGGGGGGGLRSTVTATGGGGSLESQIILSAGTPYPVGVGAGGSGVADGASTGAPTSGSGSGFASIYSIGGGAGSGDTPVTAPLTGGSGGGGCNNATNRTGAAGTANQGYAGGNGAAGANSYYASGGGGGASATGANGVSSPSFNATGGNGIAVSISGSSITYAGGGGGAMGLADSPAPATTTINGAAGGSGGGGAGGNAVHNNGSSSTNGTSGTANRGGGGGGAPGYGGAGTSHKASGNGGSGIVIIRYKA